MTEKLFPRKITGKLLPHLASREILVIYGARQTGKTSLLRHLMETRLKRNTFYLDLELPHLLELCNQGAEPVFQYLKQRGADEKEKIFLIIDEVQYLEDPSKLLKVLHDHYPAIKVIVSGSSTFEIKRKFKESLAGRTVNFEIYPLSFEEFLIFKNKTYRLEKENTSAVNKELVMLAEEYVRFGGYPGVVLKESEEEKQTYLGQIISTYIKKDIRDLGNIRNLLPFNNLLGLLASQSGGILNVLEIASTLKINRETVLNYLDLLENTFVIKRIPPFHKNLRSELSKNPKVFFMDTGMMHLLWLKEFPKVVLGNSFETFVFLELMKTAKKISFWRTAAQQEIDFIVAGKELYAIEAKYNFQNADGKNLKSFSGNYKCKTFIVGLKGEKTGKYPWEIVKELE